MKNNKNLNPLNDPEVAKMLTKYPFDIKGFEFLLCDKFVILKLVIVICLRRIIVEKERKI